MVQLDEALRPTWLFGNTLHEGCDRGGYYEQAQFAEEHGSPQCIVKLECGNRMSAHGKCWNGLRTCLRSNS
jgi:Ni,Fe-hydrogenase I small subunit